jgi:phosphatidate cytidylyltransferase
VWRETVTKGQSSFWLRILSAAVGIPVIVAIAWRGGWPLLLLVGVLYLRGLWEMLRQLSGADLKLHYFLAVISGLTIILRAYTGDGGYPGALILALLICTVPLVFFYPRYSPQEAGVTFFSTAYLSLFVYLYLLRLLPDGRYWLMLVLAATWTFDTVAYFAGRSLGKRRLTPRLSPGKTIVGFGAGLCGSAVAAGLFTIWLPVQPLGLVVTGLALGASGQVGDLVFSAVKRAAGRKDAGRLIPGHGGVMDRFDSMLLTAPLVYTVARWLMNTG